MKIILIMGLPGAGKTTLANELAKLISSKRLNADEIRRDEKGSKFYIYKKKKYGITCEKKFEIDENKMVVGVSSRGCF